jgi:hypothetical protein
VHVAIAHEGQATPVPALDGLPYIPSVVGCSHGRAIVGSPARAHLFVSPGEVLFGPARHLGGGLVNLGDRQHEPAELVARLLEDATAAGQVAARGTIEGVVLSRAAWAMPEARRALVRAAQQAGMNLLRTEVCTTLAAIARLAERGPGGLVVFVDVGGWKIEATVLSLEASLVRALGRSVDATIGANWIDGRLVKALIHRVAPDNERQLLKDRLCCAMLREQCESARVQLSTQPHSDIALPFLVQVLGVSNPPVWRLERAFLEKLAQPLLEAVQVVCGEALAQAHIEPRQIEEAIVLGGLAHMPAVRETVGSFFGRPATGRGDVDGLAARGAALLAAASLGQPSLRVIDDLDDRERGAGPAGWGHPVPPSLTPTPEPITDPFIPVPDFAPPQAARSPEPHIPLSPPKPTHAPHPSAPHVSTAEPATAHAPHPPACVPTPVVEFAPGVHRPETVVPAAPVESIHPVASPRAGDGEHSLSSEGAIRNPQDPAALAAVPLDGALILTPPLSMPMLLMAIGRRRAFSGHLRLKRDAHEASVCIVRGGAAGTSLEMEQLRRTFEWPDGSYKLSGEAPPARLLAMRQPMVAVVMHGIRSWLRVMDIRQVLDVLQPHLHEAPSVLSSRGALVPLLGLSPRELRFVEHVLDGGTSADEILRRGGIGRETAIHLLYVLHLLRALEWRCVENRPGESPAERLGQRAHKLERADHFEALGVHWSASIAEIDRAFRNLEEEMRLGGRASQIEPQAAARILARARLAHEAVANEGSRHAYLLDIHPDLDFEAIESVAEDQNQWYAWRGAEDATRETSRLKQELLELSRLQRHAPKPEK